MTTLLESPTLNYKSHKSRGHLCLVDLSTHGAKHTDWVFGRWQDSFKYSLSHKHARHCARSGHQHVSPTDMNHCSHGAYILLGKICNENMNKIFSMLDGGKT